MPVSPFISASKFKIDSSVVSITEMEEGNIHQSYVVKTAGEDSPSYLLQHKNKHVFKDVPSMMDNISRVSNHLSLKIKQTGQDPLAYTLTLIPALDNKLYYLDEEGEYWAMCLYIKDSLTYRIPLNSKIAFSGGQGTGKFHNLLSDFSEPLTDILPGFHNIRFRFEQWDAVMNKIPGSMKSGFRNEIDWIESRRQSMMNFRELFENQKIPVRVAHNDAKLANILFDKKGEALCLIDLDTVLNGSVLYDFGDAIRSYTNTGAEDDLKPEKNVSVNMEFYEAFARGYIEEAHAFLTQTEIECLAFSARYITFEQTLRFLMDYLDGSHYYRISYPEHNLQRARAQFALLSEMEKKFGEMQSHILRIYEKRIKS